MVKFLTKIHGGSQPACGPLSKELELADPVREHRVVAGNMSHCGPGTSIHSHNSTSMYQDNFRFFPFSSCVDVCMHMLLSSFLLSLLHIYILCACVRIHIYIIRYISDYIYIYIDTFHSNNLKLITVIIPMTMLIIIMYHKSKKYALHIFA